jgi:hypothetical protein
MRKLWVPTSCGCLGAAPSGTAVSPASAPASEPLGPSRGVAPPLLVLALLAGAAVRHTALPSTQLRRLASPPQPQGWGTARLAGPHPAGCCVSPPCWQQPRPRLHGCASAAAAASPPPQPPRLAARAAHSARGHAPPLPAPPTRRSARGRRSRSRRPAASAPSGAPHRVCGPAHPVDGGKGVEGRRGARGGRAAPAPGGAHPSSPCAGPPPAA